MQSDPAVACTVAPAQAAPPKRVVPSGPPEQLQVQRVIQRMQKKDPYKIFADVPSEEMVWTPQRTHHDVKQSRATAMHLDTSLSGSKDPLALLTVQMQLHRASVIVPRLRQAHGAGSRLLQDHHAAHGLQHHVGALPQG